MKQTRLGLLVLAGIGLFGAYSLFAKPNNSMPMPKDGQSGRAANLPKGKGFDFYVLALSWSPTYCQDRNAQKRDQVQCAGPRPFAFVVHGLWPQYERGYPRDCQTNFAGPSQSQARDMLDIMPSERLVFHEWRNHGTCSGVSAEDYLQLTRAAAQKIIIPDAYQSAPDWRRVSAGDVEAAFIASNPGLARNGIGVQRRGNNVSEVRVCLTLDLQPRPCREVDQDGVSDETRLSLPPSRGF